MIEIEKIEDFEPNIYNTMYNLAVDVMDTVSDDPSLSGKWTENKFAALDEEWKLDDFESKLLDFKERESWDDKYNKNQQLILVTSYRINSPNIETILPDAVVIFLDGKYKGDEIDLSKLKNKNIFYYGSNPDRFIRYFGKFGLAIKL